MQTNPYTILLILPLLGLVLLVIIKLILKNQISKKIANFKSEWGKVIPKSRDIDLISIYYKTINKNTNHIVDDKTWSDLDMDEVYKRIDVTISRIGEQKLYEILHSQRYTLEELRDFDNLIEFFNRNEEIRTKVQLLFSKLKNQDLYYFPLLFSNKLPSWPGYYWIYPSISLFTLVMIAICIMYPHLVWILIIAFISSMILHYINKLRIGSYIDSFRNIGKLSNVLGRLVKIDIIGVDKDKIKMDLQKCQITRRQTKWLSYDFGDSNELASLFFIILELIKGAFLLEPILFYSALKSIDRNKKSFRNFFETIGVIDAAISTASFRHSIKSYCKPEFHNDSESITINGLYHPLIENCIENDIALSDKSVLITGSNMAGKSTFIRAVGINFLLAQALYTSLSTEYRAPFAKVLSSINMSDDIISGKSYYQKEIESIKRMITESEKERKCIFIIDELFKGTNSFDRIALARSVLEFLSTRNSVFVSTHDIELARLLYTQFDLYYFKDNIIDGQMTFDHKLNKGIPQKSNAIKLIELNEYPSIIINNAIKYKNN